MPNNESQLIDLQEAHFQTKNYFPWSAEQVGFLDLNATVSLQIRLHKTSLILNFVEVLLEKCYWTRCNDLQKHFINSNRETPLLWTHLISGTFDKIFLRIGIGMLLYRFSLWKQCLAKTKHCSHCDSPQQTVAIDSNL